MNKYVERLYNGIIKENPTVVLMLGMCPTLAVTSTALAGFGMGMATTMVLMMSNLIISMLRNIIPDKVRMPAYIVIVATFVTVIQLLLKGYVPVLDEILGVYIPLIVVNCIILGRAEAYASKNPMLLSLFDGIGMGIGFTAALTILGLIREIIGSGSAFGIKLISEDIISPVGIFVIAPGGFLVLGVLTALRSYIVNKMQNKGKMLNVPSCNEVGCATCGNEICKGKMKKESEER